MNRKPLAYYNENDPAAAAWLCELITAGLIAPGDVDERSICDVQPSDLAGYAQVHLFGGVGGWSYALRLTGWPDARPVWTGSCPCQPFSTSRVRRYPGGTNSTRHLWPEMFRLIRECRPPIAIGEQVASADGRDWLSGVRADLEALGYAVGAADLCAASVGSPHTRQRLWWVADTTVNGCKGLQRGVKAQIPQDRTSQALDAWHGAGSPFEDWKKLLAESDVRRVDDGVSSTVDIRPRLRAYGNAIVPQVAAEFITAYLEAREAVPA